MRGEVSGRLRRRGERELAALTAFVAPAAAPPSCIVTSFTADDPCERVFVQAVGSDKFWKDEFETRAMLRTHIEALGNVLGPRQISRPTMDGETVLATLTEKVFVSDILGMLTVETLFFF